jgi:beta-lactamase regulating signal transducer with metallopeptidase domain
MDMQFFAAMVWKSALIAAAALALAGALRSRAAADRALVLRIGVAMLLALPVIALALPALKVAVWSAPAPLPRLTDAQIAMLMAMPAAPAGPPSIWDDPTPLILLAWLGGLAMAGARLVAGLATLARWTRAASEVVDPAWRAALDRVRWAAPDPDAVRLLVADGVRSPLSWGWRRPVILIDPDTLADPDDADAILAHEIAHIARRDWPALMLSRLAAALFWFNPLVWVLEREVVQQAEEAADRAAA